MDYNAAGSNARLFPYLSADCFLDAFGRFDEAGQGGVPIWGPALLATQEDAAGIRRYNRHNDGGICAGEGQVGNAMSSSTWRAFCGCGGFSGADGSSERSHVLGGTGAFSAGVDGESGLTALTAEGIASVPVEEGTGLRVNGGFGGGEGGVHSSLYKGQTAGFYRSN